MSAQPSPQSLRANIDELTEQQSDIESSNDPFEAINFYERYRSKLQQLDDLDGLTAEYQSRLDFANTRLEELRSLVEQAKTQSGDETQSADEGNSQGAHGEADPDLETETEQDGSGDSSSDSPFEPSVPDMTLDEYIGRDELKKELTSRILGPMTDRKEIERLSLSMPSGALLVGPPGTGKSRLAKALGGEEDLNYIKVKVPDIVDKYKGETGKNICNAFEKAAENSPCIVCMDEVDALTVERGGGDSAGESRMVNVFLDELENAPEGVIVFGTTNRPDIVDDAFKQEDRFEKCYEIGLPDGKMRFQLLRFYLKDRPHTLSKDDLMQAARETQGYSCRDISQVVNEAAWDVYMTDHERISWGNLMVGIENVTPLDYEHN